MVCADGKLYPAKTAVPEGCTAVGILGKVTETGHGLIISLQDATEHTWGIINGWTSVTTYAGTTLKLLPGWALGRRLTSYTTLGSTAVFLFIYFSRDSGSRNRQRRSAINNLNRLLDGAQKGQGAEGAGTSAPQGPLLQ